MDEPEKAARVEDLKEKDYHWWRVFLKDEEVFFTENKREAEGLCQYLNSVIGEHYVPRAAHDSLKDKAEKMAEALEMLYVETADYITINKLGDVHHNQSMKLSREALAAYRKEVQKETKP